VIVSCFTFIQSLVHSSKSGSVLYLPGGGGGQGSKPLTKCFPFAIIDPSCTSGTFMLETYYSNVIARQLYAQKCLKYRKIQYCLPVHISTAAVAAI